jgi:hypothetical protein
MGRFAINVAEELTWFFDGSEGDLGLSASPLEPTTKTTNPDDTSDSTAITPKAAAAEKYRRISDALHRLPIEQQRTLKLAYAPSDHGLAPYAALLGAHFPLVFFRAGREKVDGWLHRARQKGAVGREGSALITGLRKKIDEEIKAASKAYTELRRALW